MGTKTSQSAAVPGLGVSPQFVIVLFFAVSIVVGGFLLIDHHNMQRRRLAAYQILAASNARQIAVGLIIEAHDRADAAGATAMDPDAPDDAPLWLHGVDDQGAATSAYDSATILHDLLGEDLYLEALLPRGAGIDEPPDFDTWDATRRIAWIRKNGQFDLVLPSDPSQWRFAVDDAGDVPVVVQRREYAHPAADTVNVAFMDGSAQRVPIVEVEQLVKARTGKSLAALREPGEMPEQPVAAPVDSGAIDNASPIESPAE